MKITAMLLMTNILHTSEDCSMTGFEKKEKMYFIPRILTENKINSYKYVLESYLSILLFYPTLISESILVRTDYINQLFGVYQ